MSLRGKVVLVTGASRGIGKGIALAVAQEGATVIITGRHLRSRGDGLIGSLEGTTAEIKAAAKHGGSCLPMVCDHGIDASVEQLIEGIFRDHGRLDILVNNAFAGMDSMRPSQDLAAVKFWDRPLAHWDSFHHVGLRSHYTALVLAARHWVAKKQPALCVNIGSAAGAGYVFDVAYGVGKAGVDRLAADAARELRKHKVAVVSLWPGAVSTEPVEEARAAGVGTANTQAFNEMESPQFAGRGVAALGADPNVMRFSGKVVMTPELAEEYGFLDVDGKLPWGNFLPALRKMMRGPPPMWQLPPSSKKSKPKL